jgi:hypothetical protein
VDEKFPPYKELSSSDEFTAKGFSKNLLNSLKLQQKKYIRPMPDERNRQSFVKKPNLDVFVQYLGFIRDSCDKTWEKIEPRYFSVPSKD